MRILLAQLNSTIGDFEGNTKKLLRAFDEAKEHNCDIVITPEMFLCGYPPKDLMQYDHFIESCEKALLDIIEKSTNLTVFLGLIRKNSSEHGKKLFNACAVIHNKKLLGYQDKTLLPTYDVFDERRYFSPNKDFQIFQIKGEKIAVTICEDIWQHGNTDLTFSYSIDPVLELKRFNPDLLINLTASPYVANKPLLRKNLIKEVASTLNCPVALCNQVGANDSLIFDGNSMYYDKHNKYLRTAKSFEEDYFVINTVAQDLPLRRTSSKEEDLFNALVLGVKDYFQKQNFKKACLGLSGGIDSALVAVIAKEALGNENVLALVMPSRYSSTASKKDADALIKKLSISSKELSIESIFQSSLDLLSPYFSDLKPDITEENLQARIRGILLMAFSNKFGYILLSTGNKSEFAMGYTTLYGDLCGGLSILSDVSKTQVYALAHWINHKKIIIPKNIIDKPPSAELRPNQKDSDTLPDYAIIDTVIEEYVERFKDPKTIAKTHNFSLDLVYDLIKKIHLSEYKRKQAPPGLKVTQKSFLEGRDFPIVQKYI